jgi:hypothetical protein
MSSREWFTSVSVISPPASTSLNETRSSAPGSAPGGMAGAHARRTVNVGSRYLNTETFWCEGTHTAIQSRRSGDAGGVPAGCVWAGEPDQELADGSSVRRLQVRQADTFVRWILAQEGDAEVVAPMQLRNAVTALAAEVEAIYRRESADG